jgi:hypothetical protein
MMRAGRRGWNAPPSPLQVTYFFFFAPFFFFATDDLTSFP